MTRTPRQEFDTPAEWRIAFDREFVRTLNSGSEFSSEDVRDAVGLPPGAHPSVFAAHWRTMLNRNRQELRVCGLRRSGNPASRGRMILVYRKVG